MKLADILSGNEILDGSYSPDTEISDIVYDTRQGKEAPGTIFVCISGYQFDGHNYAKSAYDKGVRIFAVEKEIILPKDASVILVKSTRKFMAIASANFFGNPAKELFTIAITGTKGKTSTSYMLKSIFNAHGKKVGIIGTLGVSYKGTEIKTTMSTPDSYDLHRYFRDMADSGCDIMIMEASSQGFMLDRTYGIDFDVGVFTNISPDHISLYEHKDFDDYIRCKKTLFKQCKLGFVNKDSEHFLSITEGSHCPITTFAITNKADFNAVNPAFTSGDNCLKTEFTSIERNSFEEIKNRIELNIPGFFTIYNAISAIAVARKLGVPYPAIKEGLKNTFVRGRMELVPTNTDFTVIIDFAHNELSVQNLFETIKQYNPKRIISVFGCGGNRSKLRRYSMGEIIGRNSDISVVTSDNSRYERIEDIVADILIGINKTTNEHVIIYDRKKAIEHAIDIAKKGDVILLIGKGDEDYEEREGVKYPFSERQIVLDYVKSKYGNSKKPQDS